MQQKTGAQRQVLGSTPVYRRDQRRPHVGRNTGLFRGQGQYALRQRHFLRVQMARPSAGHACHHILPAHQQGYQDHVFRPGRPACSPDMYLHYGKQRASELRLFLSHDLCRRVLQLVRGPDAVSLIHISLLRGGLHVPQSGHQEHFLVITHNPEGQDIRPEHKHDPADRVYTPYIPLADIQLQHQL